MKTIVAYTLHNEDHTATLIRKQGMFWFVQDADGNEIRIPAKAVDETWEEADESAIEEAVENGATLEEALEEAAPPNTENIPSLADQAMAGPTVEAEADTITLADLCDKYGVVPRIARRQLRKAAAAGSIAHDARTGWVFPNTPESIDAVMALITARKRG